jgi:hypothetical protein
MRPEYHCPMLKKPLIVLAVMMMLGLTAHSQTNPVDTTIAVKKELSADSVSRSKSDDILFDTSIDYDELFRDFESFMDSILMPRSYFMASLSASRGYFNFTSKQNDVLTTTPKIAFSPMLTWYHKSGFGLNTTGYLVNDEKNINLYQFSVSPTYDYLHNKNYAFGLSYSRYFNKDSLPFYTSPLQNELYGYFNYRKSWFKPMVAVNYGWGSRTAYEERETQIQSLRLRLRGFTYVNTKESVSDFTLLFSTRHDFYWLDVFTYNDYIRFTPQINFTSGTQKFGFNQTSNTYGPNLRNTTNVLYSSENIYLDDKIDFQPLSLTLYLRGEYSIGKFFIQPQFLVDYYFPATSNNFTSLFSVNLGLVF